MKFALKATMVNDPTTGKPALGQVRVNKRGETIVTIVDGLPKLSEQQAVSMLALGAQGASNAYQATASILADNVGFLVAGLDRSTLAPKDYQKGISDNIAKLLKSKGLSAEGRGNVIGPYRSRIAAFIAAGGKFEVDSRGMLPPEKAIRIGKVLTDDEVIEGYCDRLLGIFKSASEARTDEGGDILAGVLARMEANGYTIDLPAQEADKVLMPDEQDGEEREDGRDGNKTVAEVQQIVEA